MFRSCPLTGDDDPYGLDRVENDPRLLECMQGWHSGIEADTTSLDGTTVHPGTKSCSLSIYTTGRVVFTMDADSLEIPAGKLALSRYINHISQPAKGDNPGLSFAYFISEPTNTDLGNGRTRYGEVEIVVGTDGNGLVYADARIKSAGGYSYWLRDCVFR